uniref:zinc transporter ZIP10-like isoform X1 n=2 Tax=Styela clava TaxID=7725 RepID=UPI00193A52C4|nr:zinc transporter ZIP10-like isoform X1 [Styela clava]
MQNVLVTLLLVCLIRKSYCWYTGPDGKIALEGTPEFEANKYIKKIFTKYVVDFKISDKMSEQMLAELMSNLGLGIIHKLPRSDDIPHHDEDEEDHHDRRRRKRSNPGNLDHDKQPTDVTKFADSVSSIPHFHENVTENSNNSNCLSASILIQDYGINKEGGIGAYQFGMLCPALIYLTDEKTCIEREDDDETSSKSTSAQVWGYGFLSVTVISLLSFLGVAIVPLISASFFQTLLSVLVAGAVGALSGDALLHLIPHSQSSSHEHSNEPILKNLTVLAGIYFLFVVEGIMKILQHRRERMKLDRKHNDIKDNSDEKLRSKTGNDYVNDDVEDGDRQIQLSKEKSHSHHHHHETDPHGHHHDHENMEDKGIASMAWMVIAGDGMHNFSDGVAIGAAFSISLVGGMSTSIAVFCHELPHELGDFAMLIKAGMSIKQALFYNGFAACLGYFGLIVGILIGNYAANVTPWIFAVTAGIFCTLLLSTCYLK